MFRSQIPPQPLDIATRKFVELLREQFGAGAALESEIREFVEILHEEIPYPALVLTRRQLDRACMRALYAVLGRRAAPKPLDG